MRLAIPDEPENYVTFDRLSTIKKTYFEKSDIARIVLTVDGKYFVRKISTNVYFPARNYLEAKGLRKFIVDRFNAIESCFR